MARNVPEGGTECATPAERPEIVPPRFLSLDTLPVKNVLTPGPAWRIKFRGGANVASPSRPLRRLLPGEH
jgi:hypothetical protein